ncbi:tRNA (adenosine(37)-N6)-threonylcarbamoyltransferase complex ATPase subunit type 1 TsaE [Flavobacterium noncentrifugens]|uniref:tRNA threonylcarbamoyladenosine biosynthesis protein TsaE n=1 Tax=Flavobacterium noncentrifugens TaxID=1128970 RepID=A0A1G8ZM72_9FLAO|nr:tRNA (adenosine(37)-N6)-threonylcarbamoyltransferase complex ATPase subunit type 1 TsaE [Flavobacterium noncentrifugens]GEP51911.1 tRNA (adenosine(37)-N6)-threonylcarbamoyltransferase complex ATPase subunit type 1 TsaE [Flavobacterium noncentrifugens]SDK16137.1 tRNA threonylcarbamoyladenosine biosynthesis protein TsaE [Flavobacterium noncentrifugens]
MEIQFSLDEIGAAASKLIEQNPQKVILFNGEMGAGKTTFIKSLAKKLGVNDTTGSPTFSLVNEYKTADNEIVYHFDVYRLKSENEAYDMGMDEYLYSGNWCFIEWAEKIPNLIPEEHSSVFIKVLPNGKRQLTFR